MDIADVRKRMLQAMARAKAAAADRRARADEGTLEYGRFLERMAVPLCRQLANALRAEGYGFTLATPAGGVQLVSDRSTDDAIGLVLDTSGERPLVVGRTRRRYGRRILESEKAVNEQGSIGELTEDDVLSFLLRELEPFLER